MHMPPNAILEPLTFEQFRQSAMAPLPKEGLIRVEYSSESGEGRISGEYDLSTRAFIQVRDGVVLGQRPDGARFGGNYKRESIKDYPDEGWLRPGGEGALEFAMPWLYVLDVCDHPEAFRSANREADGTVTAVLAFPGGSRGVHADRPPPQGRDVSPKTHTVTLAPDGRLIALVIEGFSQRAFVYAPIDEKRPIPLLAETPGWTFGRAELVPGKHGSAITIKRAEELAAVQPQATRTQTLRSTPQDGGPAVPQPEHISGDSIESYRWPLIACGAALVLIGGFAWYRRRGS